MTRLLQIRLSESVTRRGVIATMGAAWLALLLGIVMVTTLLLRAPQRPVDVDNTINEYNRAAFFAHNFLLVWLGGGPTEANRLASMSALPGRPNLNSDPYTVLDINPVPPIRKTPAGDEIEWGLTMAATLIPPGTGAHLRTYYRVILLEAGDTFKALTWPRPVNDTSRAVEIKPFYTVGVGLSGPLGTAVSNFMTAYYTANNSGSLGRFVTAAFTDTPIASTPYTSIEVTSIQMGADSPDTATAKPGAVVHAQVTAKASSSTTTFSTISTPLRLTLGPNKQWLVDGFDEPIHFGAVAYK